VEVSLRGTAKSTMPQAQSVMPFMPYARMSVLREAGFDSRELATR
jgi:hypothetical protein